MADKFQPLTFRPRAESLAALERIQRYHTHGLMKCNLSQAVEIALVEYAKTLPAESVPAVISQDEPKNA